jgi:hypothetical protein
MLIIYMYWNTFIHLKCFLHHKNIQSSEKLINTETSSIKDNEHVVQGLDAHIFMAYIPLHAIEDVKDRFVR